MGPTSICFGLATAAALALSACGRRTAPDAFRLALVFAFWFVSWEALRPFMTTAQLRSVDPALDALLGTLCVREWFRRPSLWRGALVFSFATQSVLHAIFRHPAMVDASSVYKLMVNATHAVQLALVSWEGGRRVGVGFLDWLVPVPAMRHKAGVSRAPRRI